MLIFRSYVSFPEGMPWNPFQWNLPSGQRLQFANWIMKISYDFPIFRCKKLIQGDFQ